MRRRFGPRLRARSFIWRNSLTTSGTQRDLRIADAAGVANADGDLQPPSNAERLLAWVHETFPERQIYIRSGGRVQFFSFGASLQATMAGLSLIFLGWVAFATVNVVFKDRIIVAKDHRFQEMQSAYENRVSDLQTSYDELNGALVAAEDRFKASADQLHTQQNIIMKFIARKGQVDQTLQVLANGSAPPPASPKPANPAPLPVAGAGDNDSDSDSVSQPAMSVMPDSLAPPEAPKPTRASFLDLGRAVGRLSGLLFGGPKAAPAAISPEMLIRHPGLRTLALETGRVAQIGVAESQLLTATEQRLAERAQTLQEVIRRTGIDSSQYARRFSDTEGVGGPDIPLQAVEIEGISDSTFKNAYLSASSMLEHMNSLLSALRHVPLTTPVHGPAFNRTSGFGARIDPFTGRSSFHPGVDFAGPYGSTVTATAPGTVVWAGARGGYGNLVEIDHGYGIRTRYGHLAAVLVHPGAVVAQGSPIGKLGSTGRSTGPHVHYEVWYDNIVRNPGNFIEAGRSVLQH